MLHQIAQEELKQSKKDCAVVHSPFIYAGMKLDFRLSDEPKRFFFILKNISKGSHVDRINRIEVISDWRRILPVLFEASIGQYPTCLQSSNM